MIFRLVLNELKIKLDGVNESEESINGEFDQPRFGFLHFRVILSQKVLLKSPDVKPYIKIYIMPWTLLHFIILDSFSFLYN